MSHLMVPILLIIVSDFPNPLITVLSVNSVNVSGMKSLMSSEIDFEQQLSIQIGLLSETNRPSSCFPLLCSVVYARKHLIHFIP
jgi:hypothetical protein